MDTRSKENKTIDDLSRSRLTGHGRYEAFIRSAQSRPPLRTAIVHPCSPEAIRAAVEARDENLLDPVLIDRSCRAQPCRGRSSGRTRRVRSGGGVDEG
jgi:hypothetical protein